MAAANDPSANASIQTAPAPSPPIKLPPRPLPPYLLEEQAQGVARLNRAAVAVVLGLAFLLASFAVRNSDFWMHLADGRALVEGKYRPWTGHDPFAYTTADTYWVNHSWLYDLGLYGLYPALGGTALVVLKGLLVAALAWTLLQVRRGRDLWLPAVCTGLALLAVSPRMLLQPALFSYLFLALTVWLLERSAPDSDAGPATARARLNALWVLPPLFVLWVNLDAWFVAGLLAVALYLAGEVLQGRARLPGAEAEPAPPLAADPRLRRLALVLAVSAVACLVNPHHLRAFALPTELAFNRATSLLADDPGFRMYFASPFTPGYFNPVIGGNVAGLAFFPLALAGLVSFALAWPRWSWWRALVWLGFFLLAAYRWHAIPFFAVVAGPIAALNFEDFAARPARRPVHPVVPIVPLVAAAVALILTKQLGRPELIVGWIVLAAVAARTAWWLVAVNRRPAPAAPPATPEPAGRRSWVAAVQIAAVLAVLLLGLKLLTLHRFYSQDLAWPVLPVPFLAFAGFVVGALAFGIVPTLGYFDRVFLDWSLGGRALTLLAGLALLVAAWPGWLGPMRHEPALARHAAWAVEPDPSLTRVAEHLARLRHDGAIKAGDEGFAISPPVAAYCAWLCPEERSFFDSRFELFSQSAATYLDLRQTLEAISNPGPQPGEDERQAADLQERQHEGMARLRSAFGKYHITHLVLSFSDRTDPTVLLMLRMAPLLNDPGQWPLLYVDGRSAVFGFRPSRATGPDPWAAFTYNPRALAFGPHPPDRAPAKGAPDPVPTPNWVAYMGGTPARSLATDEAQWQLLQFDMREGGYDQENQRDFLAATAAGLVGSANPAAGPVAAPGLLGYRLCVDGAWFHPDQPRPPRSQMVDRMARSELMLFLEERDHGPPELPLLAVRAARRAIADNPQDIVGYLTLEKAYHTQRWRTRERAWCEQMGELPIVRHVQMVAALEHVLTIQPDLALVHAELANLYHDSRSPQNGLLGYLDLQLKHMREALRLTKRAGRLPKESEKDYRERIAEFERNEEELEKAVQEQQNRFWAAANTKASALDKARDALRRGLAEDALSVLQKADVLEFGPAGAQLQIELLLTTGQIEKARLALNDPEARMKESLGEVSLGQFYAVPAYEWYELLLAAAEGNYAADDEHCKAMIDLNDPLLEVSVPLPEAREGQGEPRMGYRLRNLELALRLLANNLADTPQQKPLGYQALSHFMHMVELQGLVSVRIDLQHWAELTVLRGMLALEAGDTEQAAASFRQALAVGYPKERVLPYLALLGSQSPLEAAALAPASDQAAAGPTIDFNGRSAALRYTELLEEAAGPKK